MDNETWTTREGKTMKISEMSTRHIENAIAYFERKWEEYPEKEEVLVADHWSLAGGVFIKPGKETFRPKLKALKKELKRRKDNG